MAEPIEFERDNRRWRLMRRLQVSGTCWYETATEADLLAAGYVPATALQAAESATQQAVEKAMELGEEVERLRDAVRETVLRDCQRGVCRAAPGCARHWEERNRELVRENEVLRSNSDHLSSENASLANQVESMVMRIESLAEELAKPEDVRLREVLEALDGRAVIFDGLGARVGHLLDEMDEWIGRAGEAERLAEERLAHADQLQADIEAEMQERLALRKRLGAREDETMGAFLERLAAMAGVVPADVHEHGWQWRPTATDTAFAPPFGTIRQCRCCGCLVAGGPTACVRCAKAGSFRPAKLDVECALRAGFGGDEARAQADVAFESKPAEPHIETSPFPQAAQASANNSSPVAGASGSAESQPDPLDEPLTRRELCEALRGTTGVHALSWEAAFQELADRLEAKEPS